MTDSNLSGVITHLDPMARYRRDIKAGLLLPDAAQAGAVLAAQRLYDDLNGPPTSSDSLLRRLFARNKQDTVAPRGLYLWGRVGRGKTYIVDTFFDCLKFEQKLRIHFHSFMRRVHADLKPLTMEADPLAIIARRWARDYRIICLDEFHVGDITDAMILGRLLQALFDHGVSLVATSNEAPQNLYREGLQRERFLPAIALIESHLEIVELAGDTDYRLRALEQADVYYTPHTIAVEQELNERFSTIASEPGEAGGSIDIEGRQIPTKRHAEGVVWFDFETLCGGARSTGDYIEIALCHHTIVLSDVPVLDQYANDSARRFINLIDELYDRNVKLLISAATEAEGLYQSTRLQQAFKRTVSRLREMQSHEYLARPHLCD